VNERDKGCFTERNPLSYQIPFLPRGVRPRTLIRGHLPLGLRGSTDAGVFGVVLEGGVDNEGLGPYFARPRAATRFPCSARRRAICLVVIGEDVD
jgi:hypothetical protein